MTYAGFDRADCPDLATMARLKAATNLRWCGYYLHAPSQPASTWRGKRASLVALGWGLVPIYVGQEIVGRGSHIVTAQQGALDGTDAAREMKAEGFPLGSTVFLDLENGPPFTSVEQSYVEAWIDRVWASGYTPGVYCSYKFAQVVYNLLSRGVKIWVFHVPSVAKHDNNLAQFQTPPMEQSGFSLADIWQREDSAVLTQFGNLLVDLNVSVSPDPSSNAVSLAVDTMTTVKQNPVSGSLTPAPKADNWFVSLWKRIFNV